MDVSKFVRSLADDKLSRYKKPRFVGFFLCLLNDTQELRQYGCQQIREKLGRR
jgi:hypothetical protein